MITLRASLRLLIGVAALALVFCATAAAGPDTFKQKLNETDMAAAKATVVTKLDLGNPDDWTGNTGLPSIGSDVRCANYRPKYSDLVVTGGFASVYKQPGYNVRSVSLVLQSKRMLQLHWQRAFLASHFLSCSRTSVRRSLPPATKVVSFRMLPLPRISSDAAAHAIGWRTVYDITTPNGRIRMAVDTLVVLRGRTETGMVTTMPVSAVTSIYPNEIVIAKSLAGRIQT